MSPILVLEEAGVFLLVLLFVVILPSIRAIGPAHVGQITKHLVPDILVTDGAGSLDGVASALTS